MTACVRFFQVLLLSACSVLTFVEQAATQSTKPKATSPSNNTQNSSNTTPSNCQWTFPGDGMGPSRLICSNNTTIPVPPKPTLTPSGRGASSLPGAMQNLLNGASQSMNNWAAQGTGGNCYWSNQWNQLPPSVQSGLRQHDQIDAVFAKLGGPSQLVAYAQTPGNLEREFDSLQGQGGPEAASELKAIADGFLDVANCRLGAGGATFQTPTLIDANTFKAAGSDTIDQSVANLLDQYGATDCDSALQYVNDPNGLQKELDSAVSQRRIRENGLNLQQDLKADLFNNSWWETSKGPVILAHINMACNEFQDWVSALNPEAAKLSEGKDLLLKGLGAAAKTIKAAYDNRESVTAAVKAATQTATEELADIGGEKLADKVGMGPAYATYKALKDYADYTKTLNQAAEARETVQNMVEKLDQQIAQARGQVSIDAEKEMVLKALQQDVMNACVQKDIEIHQQ